MKSYRSSKIVSIVIITLFFVAGSFSMAAADKKPYKVGVNLAFTGPLSGMMSYLKNGLIVEVDKINSQGGIHGHPLELVYEDNAWDPAKMANIQRKFGRDKEVLAIIGPLFTAATAALTSIADREKVSAVVVCPGSAEERKNIRKHGFYIAWGDPVVGKALARLAVKKGYKKIYAFNGQEPFDVGVAKNFKKYCEEEGLNVDINPERFSSADTDMTPLILKFKDKLKNYDALLVSTNPGAGSVVMKNLYAQGVKDIPILATPNWAFNFIFSIGGKYVEGAEMMSGRAAIADQLPDSDPQKSVVLDFSKRLNDRFGHGVDTLSGHGYDAINIIAQAIARAGENPTRARVRDEIEKTKNYIGITGIYNYSPTDHEATRTDAFVPIRFEDGKFLYFQP